MKTHSSEACLLRRRQSPEARVFKEFNWQWLASGCCRD